MNVILFGSTGMVGQGVLLECQQDPSINKILTVLRKGSGQSLAKVEELVLDNFYDYSSVQERFMGYDACFFCIGVTSAGMNEADYKKITHDIAIAAAEAVLKAAPQSTFVFVSGTGADSTEQGSVMWARIKGKTENTILKMPFKASYVFRPGVIQPMNGIKSRTALYNWLYPVLVPFIFAVKVFKPSLITSTSAVGKAMIAVAKRGAPKRILENPEINQMAQ